MVNSVSTRSCDDSLSITSTSLCPPGQLDVSTIRTSVDRDDDVGGDEDLNDVDSKKVIAKALEPTDSSEKKGKGIKDLSDNIKWPKMTFLPQV